MTVRPSAIFINYSLALTATIFALHCFTIWAAPFESIYPTLPAIAILATYLFAFFLFAKSFLMLRGDGRENAQVMDSQLTSVLSDRRLCVFLLLVSLMGVGLHMWSKYYLTELRPISCISEIRFAWLEVNRDVLPTRIRVASVLGHLLTSFAYFGLMMTSFTISRSETSRSISPGDVIFQMIFTLIGSLYAGFIGSRNAMLAFLAISIVGVIIGTVYRNNTTRQVAISRPLCAAILTPLISLIVFSSLIFSNRLFCAVPDALTRSSQHNASKIVKSDGNDVSAEKIAAFHMSGYYREFALKARPQNAKLEWRNATFMEKCPICASIMVYVNHGIFNLSKVMATGERGSPILMGHIEAWSRRLGINLEIQDREAKKRVYGPGGITLAGAAYHDFGFVGVLLIASVMGILFGQSILWMQSKGLRALLGVWLFCCLLYILFISTLFVGFGVLPFPFIVFGVGSGLIVGMLINKLRPLSRRENQLIQG